MTFSEKICHYDNIKIHKKQDFTASLENTVLQNPQWEGGGGGGQIEPHF